MSESSLAVERSMAVICRNLFNDPSDLLRVDRFELVRTLGSGGMGVVYEAIDLRRGERVALKMLNGRGGGELYALKREFRALAELTHPNLVALHELSVAQDHAFFTMELVAGCDVVSYIREGAPEAGTPPNTARLTGTLAQLCDGIGALHLAGKLHLDLKPSNVLVTESGRVVLLDFGMVQDLHEQASKIGGTPEYMAPEQRQGKACEGSDWYAFGRILQLALYGRVPPASGSDSDASEGELTRLARRLLAAEPALRPGFREVSAIVRGAVRLELPAATDLSSTQRSPPRDRDGEGFVGRAAELAALEQAFAQSERRPVLVVVRGESGVGKTTLMRRFVTSALAATDTIVLRSRCYEREFVPYKALDGAIDELSRHLSAPLHDRLPRLDADEQHALLHLFPVLGRVPGLSPAVSSAADVHPVVQRRRGFDALKKVFKALAARRPLVLCIDDLQWSDADSGVLLAALLCDADAPPLLIIASDRSDPGRLNPAMEELYRACESVLSPAAIVELTLSGLPPDQAASLARSLLTDGGAHRTMPALIAAESRGNPLFVTELARWAAAAPAGFGGGMSLETIVGRRAHDLSSEARAMLELIAIAGRPLSTAVIAQALGLSSDPHRLVLELRRARLVHVVRRADAELLELDHDRIGEGVLRTLDGPRRQELHAQLARALDADAQHAEGSVAQYIAADLPEEAAKRAREAGYLALAALAFSRAAWLFQQALELGRWPDAARAHLYGELALALEHAGRGLQAAEAYRRAAELTEDPFVAVKLEAQAAEHLTHNGRPEQGFALLQRCYESLGMYWPRSRIALKLSILRLLVVLQLRRPSRRPAGAAALRISRARLFPEGVTGVEGYDPLRALHNGLLALREAEALGDAVWAARARGTRGLLRCAAVFRGGAQRGFAELEAACAVAERHGDLTALSELQLQLAIAHQFDGNPRLALLWATRCEANLRRQPLPPRGLYRVMGLIVFALHDTGELREAHRRARAFVHEARHHDDVVTSFWTHAHPSQASSLFADDDRARTDAFLEKQAGLRAQHPSFQLLVWSHAACRVETELYFGQPHAAGELLKQEQPVFFLEGVEAFDSYARLMRARVALARAAQLPRGRGRRRLLFRAWLDVRVVSRPGRGITRGAAPLLQAGIAFLRGRVDDARRHVAAAIAILDASGCKVTAASARYCLGALLPDASQGRALQAAALEVLTGEGIVNPVRWVAWTMPGFHSIMNVSDG